MHMELSRLTRRAACLLSCHPLWFTEGNRELVRNGRRFSDGYYNLTTNQTLWEERLT